MGKNSQVVSIDEKKVNRCLIIGAEYQTYYPAKTANQQACQFERFSCLPQQLNFRDVSVTKVFRLNPSPVL